MPFSHFTSYTQGQCFFHIRSTYTTTEQILHRWTPFHCSGSVATVVLWDRYACEVCDALSCSLGVRSYREGLCSL